MLVDSHAHLDFIDEFDEMLDVARVAGICKIVTIGTSIECSKKCIEIAEKYSANDLQIYATCGIHPEDGKADVDKYGDDLINVLRKVAESTNKVVGIGECGLDYYKVTGNTGRVTRKVTSDDEKEFQRKLFGEQIKLANDLDLPIVVHCRNAWEEIFDLISKFKSPGKKNSHPREGEDQILDQVENDTVALKGIFHSWTGGVEAMQKALDFGFYISFSGIVTFGNAREIKEVAMSVPLDRILIETDSPFLTPEPLRGKKNTPANVKMIASFLAEIRNQSFDDVATATSNNARELFNL